MSLKIEHVYIVNFNAIGKDYAKIGKRGKGARGCLGVKKTAPFPGAVIAQL